MYLTRKVQKAYGLMLGSVILMIIDAYYALVVIA